MNYPIETTNASGMSLYAILRALGKVWNNVSKVWVTFNPGDWALYAVPLVEDGQSGYYSTELPAEISGVLVTEVIYSQGGGTPSQGDAPPCTIGQSQGVAVAAIGDSVDAAQALLDNLGIMGRGAAVAGTLSTSQMTTDLSDTADNIYVPRLIVWTSGALTRKASYVSAYDGATRKLTFSAVAVAPAIGDKFIIL